MKEKNKTFKGENYFFKNYNKSKMNSYFQQNSNADLNIYYSTQNVILDQDKICKNGISSFKRKYYDSFNDYIENNYLFRKSYDNININNILLKGDDLSFKKYNTLLNKKKSTNKIQNKIQNNNKIKIKIIKCEKLNTFQNNNYKLNNKPIKMKKNNYAFSESNSCKGINNNKKLNTESKNIKIKKIKNMRQENIFENKSFNFQPYEEREILKNHSTVFFSKNNKSMASNKNCIDSKNQEEKNISTTNLRKELPRTCKIKKISRKIIKNEKTYLDNNDIINLINQGNKNKKNIIIRNEEKENEILNIPNHLVETIELSENRDNELSKENIKNENMLKCCENHNPNYNLDKNITIKEYLNNFPMVNQEKDNLNIGEINKIKKNLFNANYNRNRNSNKVENKIINKTRNNSSKKMINNILGVKPEKELNNNEINNQFYLVKEIKNKNIFNKNKKIIDKYIQYINGDNLINNKKIRKNKIFPLNISKKLKKYHGIKNKTIDDININCIKNIKKKEENDKKVMDISNDKTNSNIKVNDKNIYYKKFFRNNGAFFNNLKNKNKFKNSNISNENKKNKDKCNKFIQKEISPKNEITNNIYHLFNIYNNKDLKSNINSENNKKFKKTNSQHSKKMYKVKIKKNSISSNKNNGNNLNANKDNGESKSIIFNEEYYKQNVNKKFELNENLKKLEHIESIKAKRKINKNDISHRYENSYGSQLLSNTNSRYSNPLNSFNKTDIKLTNKINFDMPISIDLDKIEKEESKEENKKITLSLNNKIKSHEIKSEIQQLKKFGVFDNFKNPKIEKLENFINRLNEEEEDEEDNILKKNSIILPFNNDILGYGKSIAELELSNGCNDAHDNISNKNNIEIGFLENKKYQNLINIGDMNFYQENNKLYNFDINSNNKEKDKSSNIENKNNEIENDEKKINSIDINIPSPKKEQDLIESIKLIKNNNFNILNEGKKEEKDNGCNNNIKEIVNEYEFDLEEEKFYKPLTKYEDKFNFDKINPF